MAKELTKKEIYDRIQEWRNIKKLHEVARERIKVQNETIKLLKEEVRLLKERDKQKGSIIAELRLQIEELKRMVFGRRRKKKQEAEDEEEEEQAPRKPANRSPDSYHRTKPAEDSVTHNEHHNANTCPECKTPLESMGTRVFYEEDIVLPTEDSTPLKTITKHTVERGWCKQCRKWISSMPMPTTNVLLGPKVKIYICYLSILIRLSFEQIRTMLKTTYDFEVSDGEIAYVLHKEADALKPEYEALKDRIRTQKGVHYDETGHPVQATEQGNHAWVASGTETNEAVFLCGMSRGGGVVDVLRGEDDNAHVAITDDYCGYHNKFKRHGLCWAHPHRKFRDLKNSDKLDPATREHCRVTFEEFSALYHRIIEVCKTPFVLSDRMKKKEYLTVIFDQVTAPHPNDPPKITRIKKRLRQQKELYFTCVVNEGIPPDNNKAERSLRHLVLKRKISFGSKTQRGAETTSILASVILSLWWTKPKTFFQELVAMRGL
jgi:transposase